MSWDPSAAFKTGALRKVGMGRGPPGKANPGLEVFKGQVHEGTKASSTARFYPG